MTEKVSSCTKSRLPLALLASALFHLFITVLPYITLMYNVARPERTGSSPNKAVIKVTLASVSPLILTEDDKALQTKPDTADASAIPIQASPEYSTPPYISTTNPITTDLVNSQPPTPLIAYYPVDRLTKRPQPMSSVQLDTPLISPLIASGKIVMKLWINEWGGINDVVVEQSSLPLKFSETAITAMKQLKFTPGEFYGRKVAVLMKIEINYDDFRVPPD